MRRSKFPEFMGWFNSLEMGEMPNVSQAQITLHINYVELRNYYELLRMAGCIMTKGNTKNKKYFKISNIRIPTYY